MSSVKRLQGITYYLKEESFFLREDEVYSRTTNFFNEITKQSKLKKWNMKRKNTKMDLRLPECDCEKNVASVIRKGSKQAFMRLRKTASTLVAHVVFITNNVAS